MKIEDFIQKNKDEFDRSEPSGNHFKNFEEKLGVEFGEKRTFKIKPFLRVASIGLLVIMSSLWIIQNFLITDVQSSGRLMSLSDVSENHREVEVFYTSGINSALNELNSMGPEAAILKNEMMNSELTDLDSLYTGLQMELALKPGDERIIDAMIINYQTRLDIINNILTQLKRLKTIKTQDHETKEL